MRTVDVVVVGAGPAGTTAAADLARAGRDVLLVDRARFPRDKCCGDGLTTDALRILEELGLDPSRLPGWQAVTDLEFVGPSGRGVAFPLPRGSGTYAAVVPRVELDAALVDLARDAGAEVAEGCALTGATAHDDRVVVELEGGEPVAARYAVGADGVWSPLRRALARAPEGYRGDWHAFRQYFDGVDGPAATVLHVWFERDLLPGYAWAFPLPGGRANVGFGILRGGSVTTQAMAGLWPDLLRRPHVREALGPGAAPAAPHRAWPIPARIGQVPLSAAGGRALFVGDAAAAADPLTGEGIGQAFRTGHLAARAIVDAGALRPAGAAGAYASGVWRDLGRDAALAGWLQRLSRHPRVVRAGLRAAGATGWTRRSFARWVFEDFPRAYLGTPGRWGEHPLAGPGAFDRR
jgi:geranylgeranyl reductase family protein